MTYPFVPTVRGGMDALKSNDNQTEPTKRAAPQRKTIWRNIVLLFVNIILVVGVVFAALFYSNSGTDERYTAMKAQEIQENFSNDGSVPEVVSTVLKQVAAKYGAGKYKTPEEAAKDCAALLAQ